MPIGQHALHAGGLEGLRPELRPPRLGSKLTGVEHPVGQHCVDAGPAQQRVLKLVRRAHQLAGCPDGFQGAPVEAGDTRILSAGYLTTPERGQRLQNLGDAMPTQPPP